MFAIGDNEWAGLSKVLEEAGEVIQVGGKLMGSRGQTNHWSGDLRQMFIEELGDIVAAISFFVEKNFSEEEKDRFIDRLEVKHKLFEQWHNNDPALPESV